MRLSIAVRIVTFGRFLVLLEKTKRLTVNIQKLKNDNCEWGVAKNVPKRCSKYILKSALVLK